MHRVLVKIKKRLSMNGRLGPVGVAGISCGGVDAVERCAHVQVCDVAVDR